MKISSSLSTRKLNQVHSLPFIKNYMLKRNSEYSLNNASSTTNASIIKSSANNSALIPHKNHRILKKIKLNNKYNSQRSINSKSQIIYPPNTNKRTIEILENADQIMKERLKFNGIRGKNLLRSIALKVTKELCCKNHTIKLLKEKRTEINTKEFLINHALREFEGQYEMDHKNFINFVEEVKNRQRKDEEAILELRQIREKTENLLEKEKSLNKKLDETLERKIKEFYVVKGYASFINNILEKKFLYDGMPEIKTREKNHEEIANLIFDIYENEDKYNQLPKELNDSEILMKKYVLLEDRIITLISNKEYLDKERENIQKNYENELEQLKSTIVVYENDLKYLNQEKRNICLEMKNFKIHEDDNLDNYLDYINELGKEIGTKLESPKKIDKRYLNQFVSYSKKTLEILGNKESEINTNILEIENVLNYGEPDNKEIMKKLILKKKNINKKEKQLELKQLQEKIKEIENKKIFERANKVVVKGRKIIFDYPIINKDKLKIKKIIKRDENDNLDYQYSNTDIDEEDKY